MRREQTQKFGAPSIECECTYRFTCRYCCNNAKPYLFTPSTIQEQVSRQSKEDEE